MSAAPGVDPGPRLGAGLMALLLVSACLTAATMHFHTPMLEAMRVEFGADASRITWIPTATVFGYVVGLIFLVPLGDRLDKRALVLAKTAAMAAIAALCAAAPSIDVVTVAGFLFGVLATSAQDMVPLAAELAPDNERGRVVGTLLSGLYVGILTGRIAGGLVTEALGWRAAYVGSAVLLALVVVIQARMLPAAPSRARLPYGALLASLVTLLRAHAGLRRASAIQLLLGVCYGAFWATLAAMLAALHGLGSAAAGMIGIPGAAGILVARPVGRFIDRNGPGKVVMVGAALVVAAYTVFGFAGISVLVVVAGAMLLDIGIRASQVANQSFVNGIDPASRARINMLYMAHMFTGNSIGALAGGYAWTHGGWTMVTLLGVTFSLAALAAQWWFSRNPGDAR